MNPVLNQLLTQARNLPDSPGVYLMKNSKNKIIYIGKAKSLPKRVKTYFQVQSEKSVKTSKMVQEVRLFEHIVVSSENEALLLEYNLIKKHQPKYNIKLKYSQGYPYLKVDLNHPFPKLEITYRTPVKEKVKYFGPYPNVGKLYEIKDFLNKNLKLRTCSNNEFQNRTRPCILYQMNQCSGPCVFKNQSYLDSVSFLLGILEGKKSTLKELKTQMTLAAKSEDFEGAAKFRDLINFFNQNAPVVNQVSNSSLTYLSFKVQENSVLVGALTINLGKVENFHKVVWENFEQEPVEKFLSNNLLTYLEQLPETKQVEVSWTVPQEINQLIKDNLQRNLKTKQNLDYQKLILDNLIFEEKLSPEELSLIQQELHLSKIPYKIECIDISNWQESFPVASKVVMMEGILDKTEYRKYKLKTKGPNDFAMIKEVVLRRFKNPDLSFPDLLVVDGGAGQLTQALAALEELKVQGVEVVGLAKDKVSGDFQSSEIKTSGERIVKPNGEVILLNSQMSAFILTKLRDEAHRFALKFHRQLRSKNSLLSGIKKEED